MSHSLVFEHAYYIGNYMSAILYGVELVMYFSTLRQLMRRRAARSSYLFYLIFTTALVTLLTIDISVNAVWGEIMWINARDQPGGVPLFVETQLSSWYQALGSSSAVGLTLLAGALLLHRLFIIYSSNVYIIIFPVVLYIVAAAFAILELFSSFAAGGFFLGAKSINFGTPYYSMTIGLNVIVTSLICFQLLSYSRKVRAALGEADAPLYTGAAAILIESAAPYSLTGIMFLIPYARGSSVSVALGQVWAKCTCIAPQLIILRIVSDQAWTRETVTQARTGDFARPRRAFGIGRRRHCQESSVVELSTHIHHDMSMDSSAALSSFEMKRDTKFSTATSAYTTSDVV